MNSASELVQVPNILRAKELLNDVSTLWRHPGVTDAQRQTLVLEVFDEMTIKGKQIMAIKPKPQYAPHFAYIAVSNGGARSQGDWT